MTKKKKKETSLTPWLITTERFVGYIDIMGFKDIVARNSNEKIYEMMKKVSDALRSSEFDYGWDYEGGGFDYNLRMTTYSDSIMIYTRDNSVGCLDKFLGAIGSLTQDLFKHEIPHKGAIAYGTMTLDFDNSIFFGQPLIDAYLLQEELSFYGIIAHASTEIFDNFLNDQSVFEYNCQFKNGAAKHLTVLPNTFANDPFEEKQCLELIESVKRLRIKTSGALRKYIDNTIDYFNYSSSEWTRRIKEVESNCNLNKDGNDISEKLPV